MIHVMIHVNDRKTEHGAASVGATTPSRAENLKI
jgi:hypothetical protein